MFPKTKNKNTNTNKNKNKTYMIRERGIFFTIKLNSNILKQRLTNDQMS